MLTQKRLDKYLATIRSIVSGERVDRYVIGYTSISAADRGDQYRRVGIQHLVMLADQLEQSVALDLEERLQRACWEDRDLSIRYHDTKSQKRVYRSAGGKVTNGLCAVYIAWWDKA